jgi:hypothetical protein
MVGLGVGGMIILKTIIKKCGLRVWIDSIGSEYGPVVIPCEHGNASSCSIRDRKFNQMRDFSISGVT